MYEKLFEQAENFFKPIGEIWSIQTQAMEAISQQQSTMISGVLEDSLNYTQHLSGRGGVDSFWCAQQDYLEGLGGRIKSAAEESMDLMASSNEKVGAILQDAFPATSAATLAFMQGNPALTRSGSIKSAAAETVDKMPIPTDSGKVEAKDRKASTPRTTSKKTTIKAGANSQKASGKSEPKGSTEGASSQEPAEAPSS